MSEYSTAFHPIDTAAWDRRQYFYYFTKLLPTGYALTVELDITETYQAVKARGLRFFPAYLYVLCRQLAAQREFRFSTQDGKLGYYDVLHPSFAVLHEDDQTMSNLWVAYDPDFQKFYQNYVEDYAACADNHSILAKSGRPPENCCMIGMLPWVRFTHYAPVPYAQSDCYFPVLQAGGRFTRDERLFLPFSITVHHAVADGYHVSKFLVGVQAAFSTPKAWLA